MLGTQTRGSRMVGADESIELWRHPFLVLVFSAISTLRKTVYLRLAHLVLKTSVWRTQFSSQKLDCKWAGSLCSFFLSIRCHFQAHFRAPHSSPSSSSINTANERSCRKTERKCLSCEGRCWKIPILEKEKCRKILALEFRWKTDGKCLLLT